MQPAVDGAQWPMVFDIALGVRRDEPELRTQIEAILESEHGHIDAILRAYHVPLSPAKTPTHG